MKTLEFKTTIKASKEKVWFILWDNITYGKWTTLFCEGSYAVTDWQQGSKVHFLSPSGGVLDVGGLVAQGFEIEDAAAQLDPRVGAVRDQVHRGDIVARGEDFADLRDAILFRVEVDDLEMPVGVALQIDVGGQRACIRYARVDELDFVALNLLLRRLGGGRRCCGGRDWRGRRIKHAHLRHAIGQARVEQGQRIGRMQNARFDLFDQHARGGALSRKRLFGHAG